MEVLTQEVLWLLTQHRKGLGQSSIMGVSRTQNLWSTGAGAVFCIDGASPVCPPATNLVHVVQGE